MTSMSMSVDGMLGMVISMPGRLRCLSVGIGVPELGDFGHIRMCATPYPISWIVFILDLGPSYTDKLLEFRWVQIAHLS